MQCEFSAAVRGFHFYRNLLSPEASEVCVRHFCCRELLIERKYCWSHIEGNLRLTKFFNNRGAIIKATLTTTDARFLLKCQSQ